MGKKLLIKILILMIFLSGCSHVHEAGRVLWGTSIAHLKKARVDALSKVYDCSFNECYDAVLGLAKNEGDPDPLAEKSLTVYLKDPINDYIVFMDVPGNIDTTEVGVFFTKKYSGKIRVEVTSLSTIAKEKVAKMVFDELDSRFTSE